MIGLVEASVELFITDLLSFAMTRWCLWGLANLGFFQNRVGLQGRSRTGPQHSVFLPVAGCLGLFCSKRDSVIGLGLKPKVLLWY